MAGETVPKFASGIPRTRSFQIGRVPFRQSEVVEQHRTGSGLPMQ